MNQLAEIGRTAMRAALLEALQQRAWNISATARALGLTDGTAVRREIRRLGLEAEWRAAHERGDIVPGRRRT